MRVEKKDRKGCLLAWRSGDSTGHAPDLLGLTMLRPRLALLLVVFVPWVTACAGARPYQRSHLAQRKMLLVADPNAELLQQHVYEYREGSVGGAGVQGGGCGCN